MLSVDVSLELYRKMYLIRIAELAIQCEYFNDEMKTPMHMSMGSEAISVGVCQNLKKEDAVFGTYRSHALYLSKTEDTDGFFCEMYGKSNGVAKGKAGSMHLTNPKFGFMGSSAIVGGAIPVAAGYAFSNKYKKNDNLTVVFFGDGAINEGVFWETLNLACLMNLPILFICEDNDLAVHTSTVKRNGFNSICDIVSQFNCNVFNYNTTDVEKIYTCVGRAIDAMKNNKSPCFMRFKYYRYLEHVGVSNDFDKGYRSIEEFHNWEKKDPIMIQRKKLIYDFNIDEKELIVLEQKIKEKVNESVDLAKRSSFSNTADLYMDVFDEKNDNVS